MRIKITSHLWVQGFPNLTGIKKVYMLLNIVILYLDMKYPFPSLDVVGMSFSKGLIFRLETGQKISMVLKTDLLPCLVLLPIRMQVW